MFRYVIFLIAASVSAALFGQKPSLELGRAFNGNGDVRLWSFGLNQDIGQRIELSGKILYSAGHVIGRPETPLYNIIDDQGNYIFEGQSFRPGTQVDPGLITLNTQSDRHLHAYVNLNYKLLTKSFGNEKFAVSASAGPALAYIDEILVVEEFPGTFTSVLLSEPVTFRLLTTQYVRFIAGGGNARLSLNYKVNSDHAVGIVLQNYTFIDGGLVWYAGVTYAL